MSRIAWKEGRYSSYYGFAGKTEVVSVHWRMERNGTNWVVRTGNSIGLPIPDDLKGSDDLSEAKRMAEEAVTRWLASIGARWVEES